MYKKEMLARNIRLLRKNAGMTQSELAEKLFVRTQTVSKWENGVAEPSLETLCKLASLLHVSTDSLLENAGRTAFVGIDGGGSKTDIVLFEEDGHILDRKVIGGTNPTHLGLAAAGDKLCAALNELPREGIWIRHISAGIAGCGMPERQKALTARLTEAFPGTTVRIRSDIMNVFRAAGRTDDTAAAICGTGVAVFALKNGELHRLGGWGQLFDNLGSGYDIGREALRAALAAEDGFGVKSKLTQSVTEACGGRVFDWVIRPEHHEKSAIAALAPKVFDACRAGDPQAEKILKENFGRLKELITYAVTAYGTDTEVLVSGGIMEEKELVSRFLTPEGGITLRFPEHSQVFGACADARFGDAPVSEDFEKNFMADMNRLKEE